MSYKNPVVEVYNGVKIRKYNTCHLKFGAAFFKFLVLESERTGMPISKILMISSQPCEVCTKISVTAFNSKDEEVQIKRGLLSRPHIENNGRSIMAQAKEKSKK